MFPYGDEGVLIFVAVTSALLFVALFVLLGGDIPLAGGAR
jgi:hypothetical protein